MQGRGGLARQEGHNNKNAQPVLQSASRQCKPALPTPVVRTGFVLNIHDFHTSIQRMPLVPGSGAAAGARLS